MKYKLESWFKAFFKMEVKCDVVDNNMSETFNGWILEARCKTIITMLEDIRVNVMNRLWSLTMECQSWMIVDISPRGMKKLEKNMER